MVHRLLSVPPELLEGDVEPQVELGDDGMITLTFDNGEGEVRVMKVKAMIRHGADPKDATCGNVKIDTNDGQIKVRITNIEDDEN